MGGTIDGICQVRLAPLLTRPSLVMNLQGHGIRYRKWFEVFGVFPRLGVSMMIVDMWYRFQFYVGYSVGENTEENDETDYDRENGQSSKQ